MVAVPPYIAALAPYEPGKAIVELQRATVVRRSSFDKLTMSSRCAHDERNARDIIKLASNENPMGPSPKARAAISAAAADCHRYPDGGLALKQAIARRCGIDATNVILGSGSDSLMLAIVRAFVTEGGEVLTAAASFAQYTLMPRSRGATVDHVPMRDDRYDLAAIAGRIGPKTQCIFLANPNNPTGTIFTRAEWEAFYPRVPSSVPIVCDEAYAEFVRDLPDWPDSMAYRYDNVITLRTFSKAYGLAGLRLGYGMAHADIIRELHKVKLPFEPSSVALAAGEAALADDAFLERYLACVREGRAYCQGRLARMGVAVVPSVANFLMVRFADAVTMQRIHAGLLADGIIVRPLGAFGLPEALRITIGLPEENTRCMDAMEELITTSNGG